MSEVFRVKISYTPDDAIGEHKIVWKEESESETNCRVGKFRFRPTNYLESFLESFLIKNK